MIVYTILYHTIPYYTIPCSTGDSALPAIGMLLSSRSQGMFLSILSILSVIHRLRAEAETETETETMVKLGVQRSEDGS